MATSFLLIAVCVAAILLSRKLYRDVFTPLCVYVSVWSLCLLLFHLRLVNYFELETRSVALIAASILSFGVGCLMARQKIPKFEKNAASVIDLKSLESVTKTMFVLNLLGTLIFVHQMDSMYGLGTYISDVGIIRRDYQAWTHLGPLGFLTMLDYPLMACAVAHYIGTRKWRWFSVCALILVTCQTVLRTDRGSLTYYSITGVALWIYWNRWRVLDWKMVRRLGMVAVLLVGYFLGLGYSYGKLASLDNGVLEAKDLTVTSEVAVALASPYIYATSPIGGFQAAIADVSHLEWGTHTFYPVARVLYGLGIIDQQLEPYNFDYYMVPIPVNTYTHLYTFYQDFGSAGVVFFPLVLGYLETRAYLRMRARPTLFLLGASAAFMALNVFSVFVPLVIGLAFWYYFMVLYAVSRLCHSPGTALEPASLTGAVPRTV